MFKRIQIKIPKSITMWSWEEKIREERRKEKRTNERKESKEKIVKEEREHQLNTH